MSQNSPLAKGETEMFARMADALSCGFGHKENVREEGGFYVLDFGYGKSSVPVGSPKKVTPFMNLLMNSGRFFWHLHAIAHPDDFVDIEEVRREAAEDFSTIRRRLEKIPVCMSEKAFERFLEDQWTWETETVTHPSVIGKARIRCGDVFAETEFLPLHFGKDEDSLSACLAAFASAPELMKASRAVARGASPSHPDIVGAVRRLVSTRTEIKGQIFSEAWTERLAEFSGARTPAW